MLFMIFCVLLIIIIIVKFYM